METSLSQNNNATNIQLTIVVPVYDEEDAVGLFLSQLTPVLDKIQALFKPDDGIELLFVDDGSTDKTLEKLQGEYINGCLVRVIKLSRNFGKDAAMAAGLKYARGNAVVTIDVDLQDPPGVLLTMVCAWLDGAKVVSAVRTDRSSDTWLKRKTASFFYAVYNKLARRPIQPNAGDFCLIDREVVTALNDMPERVRFMKGLYAWVGYSPVRIEYCRGVRVAGQTKWRYWSLWNFALDGITGSTTLPLRIWSYGGVALALLAFFYAVFIIIRTFIYGIDTPGYASLMVVVLVLGAVNFIALGIIGEYIGRIAVEVRKRPLYLVEDVIDISKD